MTISNKMKYMSPKGQNLNFSEIIPTTQKQIQSYHRTIELIEQKLREKNLPMEQRIDYENQLTEIKASLLKCEDELKHIYGKNHKTYMFAVLLMFFSFLFYGIYLMITNPNY